MFGVDLALAYPGAMRRKLREELPHARELLRDAMNELRAMMLGLRPRLLEEKGFVRRWKRWREWPRSGDPR